MIMLKKHIQLIGNLVKRRYRAGSY